MKPRTRHDPRRDFVGFFVDDVAYAVPVAAVREVCLPLVVERLPRSPSGVVGVASYRGVVVPVVDLRERFGLPPLVGGRRKWLLVDAAGPLVALVVDSVSAVFGAQGASLKPPPALGGGEDVRGLAGVTERDGRLVFVLDVARVGDYATTALSGTHAR